MNRVGKDGGRLDYFVDGYYWDDTMAHTESVIVEIHEQIKAKQDAIAKAIDASILRLLISEWLTLEALYARIREETDEIREDLSEDLVETRCEILTGAGKIARELVNEDNDEFYICRKLVNLNGE